MRCEFINYDNALDGVCGAKAVWIVQLAAEGYPVKEPVVRLRQTFCGLHALAIMTQAIAEPERHNASVHAVRIENAQDMLQPSNRRRIGQ